MLRPPLASGNAAAGVINQEWSISTMGFWDVFYGSFFPEDAGISAGPAAGPGKVRNPACPVLIIRGSIIYIPTGPLLAPPYPYAALIF